MKTKKLLKAMIDKDLNNVKLAELTGVTDRQIRRIIIGKSNGSLKWWKKAAEVLGVDVTEIIED
jgi:DNA-binding Xre family transcriptional regulator